ncbi:MAG: succinyl-CoA synthetase subunit beta [Gemmatimonadetes bacterium]|nr:MAG: succinyl-CoA synthetase subunit beta [Gemmatimonadota bacterium]
MARIHEFQGKALLKQHKISVPHGRAARTPDEVYQIALEIGKPVVIKAQAWTTGRAGLGLIQFADTPDEAKSIAESLFGQIVKGFPVEVLLVEEKIRIAQEFYAGVIIDDKNACPLMIFSSKGGTGIEEIAAKHPDKVAQYQIDIIEGLRDFEARDLIRRTGIHGKLQMKLANVLVQLYQTARDHEARSAEINPLVVLEDGAILAADCRITVDDYAVFRHPELGIDVAREFGHPPSELDLIAYNVEKNDYRGTFYFVQMETGFQAGEKYIGFHGAGGGGSMMSMDAVTRKGYKIANFTDTSGNPPASKVYRAAKIILAQKGIDGYFGSGSGVASQEQFHSARGLVKAFREEQLSIPAVIRLGGNAEDKAVEILETYTKDLPAPVEGYKKDDSVDFCAERFDQLVQQVKEQGLKPATPFQKPEAKEPYVFQTLTGSVTFDYALCAGCESHACVEQCVPQILKIDEHGLPVLAISIEEAAKGKCTECLACEIECYFHGNKGGYVDLPIPGLEEYRRKQ